MGSSAQVDFGFGFVSNEELDKPEHAELARAIVALNLTMQSHGSDGVEGMMLVVTESYLHGDWDGATEVPLDALYAQSMEHKDSWAERLAKGIETLREFAGEYAEENDDVDWVDLEDEERERYDIGKMYRALRGQKAHWFFVCSWG